MRSDGPALTWGRANLREASSRDAASMLDCGTGTGTGTRANARSLPLHLDAHDHGRMSRHGRAGRAGAIFRIRLSVFGKMGHHVHMGFRHYGAVAAFAVHLHVVAAGGLRELDGIADLSRTLLLPCVLRIGGAHLHLGAHGFAVVQHHGHVDLPLAGLKRELWVLGQGPGWREAHYHAECQDVRRNSHNLAL